MSTVNGRPAAPVPGTRSMHTQETPVVSTKPRAAAGCAPTSYEFVSPVHAVAP